MKPVWPSDLPQRVLAENFSMGIGNGRKVTSMERGPPLMRRITAATIAPVQCSIITDRNGWSRLNRFVAEELKGGVLSFLMRDQLNDDMPLSTATGILLTTKSGDYILRRSWWVVAFGEEMPQLDQIQGNVVHITFTLIKLP